MNSGNVFLKRGASYNITPGNFEVLQVLDDGIYEIFCNPISGELSLIRIADKFHFGFKLYGLDENLCNHVIDTYNKQEAKRNLGVLLNGAKGTGKTVTAKYLANKLGLPIIICDAPYRGLANFLANINHDCIFFFDEFEKNFRMKCDDEECAGEDLLSIMDGVYNSDNCHVFLFTTNELKINENMLCRPSRIRYIKSFPDTLDRKVLEEFIDDNLKYPEYKQEVIDFVERLTMATIDIVKTIIDEINIHHCSIDTFKSFFNIKEASYKYYGRSWNFYANDYANNADGLLKHLSELEKKGGYIDDDDDIETSEANPKRKRRKIKIADDGDCPSKESFLKKCNNYSVNDIWRPNFTDLTTTREIKKFKVGDRIENVWEIKEFDIENKYMFCERIDSRGRFRHYYFDNLDARPNLYAKTGYIDNAYDGAYEW